MTCSQQNNTSKPAGDPKFGIHRHIKVTITNILRKIEAKMDKKKRMKI